MGTFTSITSVSHAYFTKRGKDFTKRHILELCGILKTTPPIKEWLDTRSADQLANEAMRLHRLLPED